MAGIISYVFWEWAFWGVSVPGCVLGYREVTGHWPDLTNSEDQVCRARPHFCCPEPQTHLVAPVFSPQAKLGAEAFAFVNVARFAIPLRIGLALGTTPWVQSNIVDKFQKKED